MNRASLVLTALLAAGAAAHAQPAPPVPPAPAPAPAPAPTPADAAYQEARRLYDLREWDAAIAKFKEAYRLRPDAPSLFNIAQSNRLKGDCAEALSFYKTYKRNFPNEKNIDKVDKFIGDMEACVKANPTKVDPTTNPTTTNPTTEPGKTEPVTTEPAKTEPAQPLSQTPVPPPPAEDPGKSMRITGIVVGGVGVASLGTSLLFALRARSAARDAESAQAGETWNPAIQSKGESSARNGKITAIVGGALVATGTVLFVLGRKSTAEASHLAVVPAHDGASFVWGSDF